MYALPALGALVLSRLEPRHLERLYADGLTSGAAPATVRQLHAVLRSALGQAAQWGTVVRNVALLVRPPRLKRHDLTPLSAAQARALLDAAQAERFAALYVLAITTGMRLGELLGLCWRDVDLETGQLHIQHTMLRLPDGLKLREPKTPQSRRRIALTPQAVAALWHHRAQQAMERLQLGAAWADHDLVLAHAIGRPVEQGNLLSRSFWPLLARAALPRIRFHDLRHTCATLLLKQGVHVKIVSEMLGHSNIKITLDIYSHVLPDMQTPAVDAMDRLLGP